MESYENQRENLTTAQPRPNFENLNSRSRSKSSISLAPSQCCSLSQAMHLRDANLLSNRALREQARSHNPQISRLLQVPIELGVEPAFCNQLLVIAIFSNAPAIKYQYPVCLFYRRQAMSND